MQCILCIIRQLFILLCISSAVLKVASQEGFSFASNISSVYVARKQKERNIMSLSLCFPVLLTPLFSTQMEQNYSLSSYTVEKGRTGLGRGWGSYDLASIALVNGLWWQGMGSIPTLHVLLTEGWFTALKTVHNMLRLAAPDWKY